MIVETTSLTPRLTFKYPAIEAQSPPTVIAITIIAATELARRRQSEETLVLDKIQCSKHTYQIMQPIISELHYEEFWVICLSNSNKVLYKTQLSKGGITGTVVDIRMVFKTALEHNAVSIVLAHNHPSGSLKPSQADKDITKQIKIAGNLLNINLQDHIIVTENGYYSFADDLELSE